MLAALLVLLSSGLCSAGVNVTWTDNSNNETGFEIERCTGAACGNFVKVGSTLPANSVAFADTATTEATTYCYRVRAVGAGGAVSVYSNTACATTLLNGPSNTVAIPQ